MYSLNDLISRMYHAPIEIIGLSIFAAFGVKNFSIIIDLLKKKKIVLRGLPNFADLVPPTILLFTAAFIEAYFN